MGTGTRLNDFAHGRLDVAKLNPLDIVIRKNWNYRDTGSEASEAHIQWLMESIKKIGIQEPVDVEFDNGKILLINGECRVLACRRLWEQGFKVPYKDGGEGPPLVLAIQKSGDEAAILATSMVANGALPPTKLEFGAAADRLEKLGWTPDMIAFYVPPHLGLKGRKATRYVNEAVDLHHAPIEVKKAVKEGVDGVKVTESLALAATKGNRMHATEIIAEAVKEAKAKGKKVAKRPKGAGEAAIKKASFQAYTDKLLEIADSIAEMVLDDKVMLDDVQKKARQYLRLRKA